MDQHDRVKQLSDSDLRQELMQAGEAVGPITATTRPIFERKLIRCLLGDQEHTTEPQPIVDAKNTTKLNGKNDPDRSLNSSQLSADGDKIVYYGVAVPSTFPEVKGERVFDSKKEALQFMKGIAGSRFKMFSNREAALEYSVGQIECTPKVVPKQDDNNPESSAFKGPKIQDLVKLRKAIENGQLTVVRNTIWTNPRYLVSSGDTPVILQEGFRYNPLHVCAQKNQSGVAQLLLDTLNDTAFYQLLYPQDSPDTTYRRLEHMVDLYLNMPDKGNGETPLHFACKFGHADVVAVLLSQRVTSRNKLNKHGETARQVICTRSKVTPGEVRDVIEDLFDACYFVPLLRREDDSGPAVVGEPLSPDQGSPLSKLSTTSMDSPTESPLAIRALAGPMSPKQAQMFRKHWLTPPSPHNPESRRLQEIRLSDSEKGFERIGRNKARECGFGWEEYWDFLKDFADLTTIEGLKKLESYLRERQRQADRDQADGLQKKDRGLKEDGISSNNNNEDSLSETMTSEEDSLDDLSNYFKKLKLSSPTSPPIVPPILEQDPIPPKDDKKKSSSTPPSANIDIPSGAYIQPHKFGNSTMPTSFDVQKGADTVGLDGDCLHYSDIIKDNAYRDNGVYNVDGWESDESCDTYYTAANSPPPVEMVTPPSSPVYTPVFIAGFEPSKVDLDVLRAIEVCDLSPTLHPHVCSWQKHVLSYNDEERKSWRTPMQWKLQRASTPCDSMDNSLIQTPTNKLPRRQSGTPNFRLQPIKTDLNKSVFSVQSY